MQWRPFHVIQFIIILLLWSYFVNEGWENPFVRMQNDIQPSTNKKINLVLNHFSYKYYKRFVS